MGAGPYWKNDEVWWRRDGRSVAKHQRSWTRDGEGGRGAHSIKIGPQMGKGERRSIA